MGEITERTKVTLQIGAALGLVVVVLGIGRYWGGAEVRTEATAATLARHETEIVDLRRAVTEMNGTLRDIRSEQTNSRESLNTAVRNTTYLVTEVSELKVTLAERGIRVRENGG